MGTTLKSTEVIGFACYLGNDTKIGISREKTKIKRTSLDCYIEKHSKIIFLLQILIVLVLGAFGNIVNKVSGIQELMVIPLRMMLLLSLFIPISLKVSVDIGKSICSKFINYDIELYDETNGCSKTFNTSVPDELGNIEYIFSDKTGTLTENAMELKMICFADESLHLEDFIKVSTPKNSFQILILKSILLCNNLKIKNDHVTGSYEYSGNSPDEISLVEGLRKIDFILMQNNRDNKKIFLFGNEKTYEILHVLQFSSDRKRMSVILRNLSTQKIILFTKGADDVILPRCSSGINAKIISHIDSYSDLGLRVLVFAYKNITDAFYLNIKNKLEDANKLLEKRKQEIEKINEEIECELCLLGATGIEDKLQNGIVDTVKSLQNAGIKTWMLTGDKLKTAVKIARMSAFISNSAPNHDNKLLELNADMANILEVLRTGIEKAPMYIVFEGEFLKNLENSHGLQALFVELISHAKSVVGSRLTPHQKSFVVKVVKDITKKRCLCIGDGGNDVLMIQAADVGVAVYGNEGMQAIRASDIAIPKFKMLKKLLLVHGKYSYHRIQNIAYYCFYKSAIICIIQVIYQFVSKFSGTSLFSSYSLSLYNILYAGMPVLFQVLIRPNPPTCLMNNHALYNVRTKNTALFCTTLALSMFHALIVFYTCIYSVSSYENNRLITTLDKKEYSFVYYTVVVILIQLVLLLHSATITLLNVAIALITVLGYFASTLIFSKFQLFGLDRRVFYFMLSPLHIFTVIVALVLCIVINLFLLKTGNAKLDKDEGCPSEIISQEHA